MTRTWSTAPSGAGATARVTSSEIGKTGAWRLQRSPARAFSAALTATGCWSA
jgi:hypothetical protein